MARFRLYVPVEDRVIDAQPVYTRDVVAVGVGFSAWLIALAVVLGADLAARATGATTWGDIVFAGLGIGIGLLAVSVRRALRR